MNPMKGDQFILIAPIDGCGPCYRKSIVFAKRHSSIEKFHLILVSKGGRKNALLAYGDPLPKSYLIDSKGLLFEKQFTNGYVTLVKILDGKIISETNFDPENVDEKLNQLDANLKSK